MTFRHFTKSNLGLIIALLVLGTIYFSVDARSFLIRGLMKTGLYKPDIKSDRVKMIQSNNWELPADITFTNAGGQEVKLADHKGKLLFINFWATWCPPCLAEMPSINSLQSKVKNIRGIEFFMVEVDGKAEAAVKLMNKKNYSLPVYTISSFLPPEIFDGNLPTTLLISPEGKVVYHHIGAADYDHPDFLKFINSFYQVRSSIN